MVLGAGGRLLAVGVAVATVEALTVSLTVTSSEAVQAWLSLSLWLRRYGCEHGIVCCRAMGASGVEGIFLLVFGLGQQ